MMMIMMMMMMSIGNDCVEVSVRVNNAQEYKYTPISNKDVSGSK